MARVRGGLRAGRATARSARASGVAVCGSGAPTSCGQGNNGRTSATSFTHRRARGLWSAAAWPHAGVRRRGRHQQRLFRRPRLGLAFPARARGQRSAQAPDLARLAPSLARALRTSNGVPMVPQCLKRRVRACGRTGQKSACCHGVGQRPGVAAGRIVARVRSLAGGAWDACGARGPSQRILATLHQTHSMCARARGPGWHCARHWRAPLASRLRAWQCGATGSQALACGAPRSALTKSTPSKHISVCAVVKPSAIWRMGDWQAVHTHLLLPTCTAQQAWAHRPATHWFKAACCFRTHGSVAVTSHRRITLCTALEVPPSALAPEQKNARTDMHGNVRCPLSCAATSGTVSLPEES